MKEILNTFRMRLPALLLLAVSLLFWSWYDRYEPVGPLLLESPALSDAFMVQGDCSETNGIISLYVPAGGKSAQARFRLSFAPDYECIRITGRIRTENVVRGKNGWSCARLLMIQRDAKGKWVHSHHALYAEAGTTDWVDQVNEFEVEPEAAAFEIVLQQIGKSGRADYSEITAQAVRVRPSFTWFRLLFSGIWVLMGLLYFKRCRLDRRKLRILIILNTMAILCGTLMPGKWIAEASVLLKQQVTKTIDHAPAVESVPTSVKSKKGCGSSVNIKRIEQFKSLVDNAHKAGHFLLFGSLCFLVYCSAWLEKQHPVYYLKVALDILLFAAISESLQYLTNDRIPGWFDWRTDLYGMLLAFILFLLVRGVAGFISKFGRA